MFQEMQCSLGGGGGSSIGHLVEVGLTHTMNSTSITRTVSVDGVQVVNDTISATNQGNGFDDTSTFNAGGTSVSWRAYHLSSDGTPNLNNDITINGVTASFWALVSKSLAQNNNLTNPYTWTYQFLA